METLTLTGNNTYSGSTNINAGSLILTGSIASNTSVAVVANLLGSGVISGNVTNAGTIASSFNGAQTNLTINGNYIGAGGNLQSNVYAPVTNPVADQLVVSGNTSGSTGILITDRGGLGNKTTGNDIPVVLVGGTSTASAFYLSKRVEAGAFEYHLWAALLV